MVDNTALYYGRESGPWHDGLYYNYHTMAKALAVYGEEKIQVKGREDRVDWRKELLEKLIEIPKGD